MLRLPFESETARKSNEDIFEAIYYAACEASGDLAVLRDHTRRSTAEPSPFAFGLVGKTGALEAWLDFIIGFDAMLAFGYAGRTGALEAY